MAKNSNDFDGFYAAYFTGAFGSSIAILTFLNGRIAGADIGGGLYDGKYELAKGVNTVQCEVEFVLRAGNQSITGATSQSEPVRVKVPLELPSIIDPNGVHLIKTPIGAINARFEKLRGY